MMKYKGYIGRVDFDDEAEIFTVKWSNTKDVITFQGRTAHALKKAFVDSVEDYLSFCAERKEQPDRPFSGRFNLRLSPELHQRIYLAARQSGESLNGWISHTLKRVVEMP